MYGSSLKRYIKKLLGFTMAALLMVTAIPQFSTNVLAVSNYYVATTGNDTTGDGSIGNPWRTIQKAADTMQAGDTCYIRSGVYRETVTPANSGTSGNEIKFEAYQDEDVTVSGCDLVTGWTQYQGSIYQADMNWNFESGNGDMVYVDGEFATEARWPNISTPGESLDRTKRATIDSVTTGTTDSTITDTDDPNDPNDSYLTQFPDDYWNGALVVSNNGVAYFSIAEPITDFTSSTGTLHHTPISMSSWYDNIPGNKYYITRSLHALDVAMEWYHDIANNRLYLIAPGGDSPANHTVESKTRRYGFDLSGKSYVTINKINFRGTSIKTRNSTYCTISNGQFNGIDRYLASGQICGLNTAGLGIEGNHNTVKSCEIYYTGGTAVYIKETFKTADEPITEPLECNNIINCYIHDVELDGGLDGAVLAEGSGNLISNNTICRSARLILASYGSRSVVQYNHLYDALMMTNDGGIFYVGGNNYGGSQIHHNIIHDNDASFSGGGIYLDSQSSNISIFNNVVYNVGNLQSLFVNSTSNSINIINNTFYDNGKGLAEKIANGVYFINNIFTDDCLVDPQVYNSNNLVGKDPEFVNSSSNDLHLTSSSPAIDAGIFVKSITDGYKGSAPDCGAYEYGGTNWTAGHDFSNPPNPSYTLINIPLANSVQNNGFEEGQLSSWTKTGDQNVTQCTGNSWDYNADTDGRVVNTCSGSAMIKGGSGLEQTITGLQPNTTYSFAGWAIIDGFYKKATEYTFGSGTAHWDYDPYDNTKLATYRGCQYVGPMRDGDYLKFSGIDFGNGIYNMLAAGLINTQDLGTIEVHLGSTTGTLLGTLNIISNRDEWNFESTSISSATGTQDLYLVFKYPADPNLDLGYIESFKLYNTTMEDDVQLGVKDYGGSDKSVTVTSTRWGYKEHYLEFTTGPSSTSATIYANKPDGSYYAYVDDFRLVRQPVTFTNPNTDKYFSDGFENSLSNWTATNCSSSDTQVHGGSYSLNPNSDLSYVYKNFNTNFNKALSVWFYDDASDTSAQCLAEPFDGTNDSALGVVTNTSTTKYVYRTNSGITASNVNRTTGWHEFKFDYTSGSGVKMYIDNVLVATSSSPTYFNQLYLGDWWSDSKTMNCYFDDLQIKDNSELAPDDFENGLLNWNGDSGTPSTSTVQKKSGSTSYIVNEDVDYIKQKSTRSYNQVASIWFYDDASDTSVKCTASIDDGSSGNCRGIGVNTSTSSSNYVYESGSTFTATNIVRTAGWHKLEWDYLSGSRVDMYIDSIRIASINGLSSFNTITLGDMWSDGVSGTNYFDDFMINDTLQSEGFENGLSLWTTVENCSASGTQKHGGSYSLNPNSDLSYVCKEFNTNLNTVLSMWFYDDVSDTSAQCLAEPHDGTNNTALGVVTDTSSTKYVYRTNSGITATNINRSTGWHEFKFDFTSGSGVKMYIDGSLVATDSNATFFNQLFLGDWWSDGKSMNCYFDDITGIMNSDYWFFDGFENGFSNWNHTYSDVEPYAYNYWKHGGSLAFKTGYDRTSIDKTFSVNLNKVVSIWVYDDTMDNNFESWSWVHQSSNPSNVRGIGMDSANSSDKYVYRVDSTIYITNISRTTGWHEFKYDYTSGTKVDMYIDGTLIDSPTGVTSFNYIFLGDAWSRNCAGSATYDDVSIK